MDLIGDLLPPGVLNVVNGFGLEAGKPLASNKRIAKIAFTGETTTGRLIMQYASREHHPGDARARRQIAEHLLRRRDGAGRRLLRQGARRLRDVRAQPGRGLHLPEPRARPESIYDQFMERAIARVEGDQAGQPARPDDHDRRAGLLRPDREDPVLLDIGRQEGAKVLTGGERATSTATSPAASTSSRPSSRATTRCASSRRRSSARSLRDDVQGRRGRARDRQRHALRPRRRRLDPRRQPRLPLRPRRSRPAASGPTATTLYPAHAAFGGYKQSGIGRENHKMMLDHYQQTKNLLVSYSPKALGFF